MKLLLDHCVPRRFRQLLPGHDVKTAFEMGWSSLKNGALLSQAAAGGFDLFITVDQNVQYQQNLGALPLSVLVLVAVDNRLPTLAPFAPAIIALLNGLPTRAMILLDKNLQPHVLQPPSNPAP
jgi:hypothetical protein